MLSQSTHAAALAHARHLTNDHREAALLPLVDAYETGYCAGAALARAQPRRGLPGLFTRSRAESWRKTQPRPVRQLSFSQRALCLLLTLLAAPLLLLGFVLLGERPARPKPNGATHLAPVGSP